MRKQCTPETPYTKERDEEEPRLYWEHQEAHEIRDHGETRRMKCFTCGVEWTEELPE